MSMNNDNKETSILRREPDTPQGTIALLAVYLLIIIFLWGNVFFTMRARGMNAPTSDVNPPTTTSLIAGQFSSVETLKGLFI